MAILKCFRKILLLAVLFFISPLENASLWAADYQWSTSVTGVSIDGLDSGYPRAFLWIPPNCKQVRAIVFSFNNMEEESILEDANFRQTLSDLGFAEVWITPSLGSIHFRFDQGQDKLLDKVLKDLADTSGYQELAFAPLVAMGHSATASMGWDIAAWNPGRTLAVLSISGQWPYFKDTNMDKDSSPDWGNRTIDGVPGLTTKGEYEIEGNTDGWYFHLRGNSLKDHPQTVFTQVVEPGGGHFYASPEKIALIGLYLRKAAQYRLPVDAPLDGPVALTPIDPTKTGWLFDEWHLSNGPSEPAAPVAEFKANKDHAFWAFDEEMAKAIEDFQSKNKNKTNVLIAYNQSRGFTAPVPDHAMVHLQFEPQADGQTIKLTGGFWGTVPTTTKDEQPEWAKWLTETSPNPMHPNDPLTYPKDEENKITINRITGPMVQTGPDTFVIHPYRIGTQDVRKSNDVWLAAVYPGDDTYQMMVQQAELRFPLKNSTGTAQVITFPKIPDQATAGTAPIKLQATSSAADAPISYYVREGPAEIDQDGNLSFTPIPPRSKYPIVVTVVATQWGRSIDPKLQTAMPVEQSFSISGPATP